ncbi:MAG: hypothetical protein MI867_17375, partial [Pseudomonadales bacterium]|nr:hypothetical protein [Pseudomonadales bacterium]
ILPLAANFPMYAGMNRDLGDLILPPRGALRIRIQGERPPEKTSCTVTIHHAGIPENQRSEDNALAVRSLDDFPNTITFQSLPEGPAAVAIRGFKAAWLFSPGRLEVPINADFTAEVTTDYEPRTFYYFESNTGIAKAVIKSIEGGFRQELETFEMLPFWGDLTDGPRAVIAGKQGLVLGFAPGDWLLELTDDQGRTAAIPFQLEVGVPHRQQLEPVWR